MLKKNSDIKLPAENKKNLNIPFAPVKEDVVIKNQVVNYRYTSYSVQFSSNDLEKDNDDLNLNQDQLDRIVVQTFQTMLDSYKASMIEEIEFFNQKKLKNFQENLEGKKRTITEQDWLYGCMIGILFLIIQLFYIAL